MLIWHNPVWLVHAPARTTPLFTLPKALYSRLLIPGLEQRSRTHPRTIRHISHNFQIYIPLNYILEVA